MPNTKPSIVDRESLALVKDRARNGARCDYGIYVGANECNSLVLKGIVEEDGENGEKEMFCNGVSSLKMYLNDTFSTLKMGNVASWVEHFKHWTSDLPIVCHAEGQTMSAVLNLANVCFFYFIFFLFYFFFILFFIFIFYFFIFYFLFFGYFLLIYFISLCTHLFTPSPPALQPSCAHCPCVFKM